MSCQTYASSSSSSASSSSESAPNPVNAKVLFSIKICELPATMRSLDIILEVLLRNLDSVKIHFRDVCLTAFPVLWHVYERRYGSVTSNPRLERLVYPFCSISEYVVHNIYLNNLAAYYMRLRIIKCIYESSIGYHFIVPSYTNWARALRVVPRSPEILPLC